MAGQSLEDRLRALEDERDIARTLGRYARSIDEARDIELFLDCFTETALWVVERAGRWANGTAEMRIEGRPALRSWFEGYASRRQPDHAGKHAYLPPAIAIDGDRAVVDSYYFILTATESGPLVHSFGRLYDVFVRCADGRWRIQERRLSRESGVPEARR